MVGMEEEDTLLIVVGRTQPVGMKEEDKLLIVVGGMQLVGMPKQADMKGKEMLNMMWQVVVHKKIQKPKVVVVHKKIQKLKVVLGTLMSVLNMVAL